MPNSDPFRGVPLVLWGILLLLGPSTGAVQAQAPTVPSAGEESAWSGQLPIEVRRDHPDRAGLLPVDVTFALPVDSMADATRPRRELRLVYVREEERREVPFQLSRLSVRREDTGEASVPTLTGQITFFEVTPHDPDGRYLLLYGNDEADPPEYETDLAVRGEAPGWTLENSALVARLEEGSGQLDSVTLKSHPDRPYANESGPLHWNPGISIPERGWVHAYDWNPPAQVHIERGPLFVEVRRRGPFPGIPEAHLEVTYRVFKERAYVWSGTRIRVDDEIGVTALRNDELVFDPSLFTHLAWAEDGTVRQGQFDNYEPVNDHGDLLRLPHDVPLVAFYNPETQMGAATVRMEAMNVGPAAASPTQFDRATYLVDDENLTYWFRSQVYLHADWPRRQLITVPAGAEFIERNLYCFYDTDTWGAVRRVERLSNAARHEPDVRVGLYKVPSPR